MIQTNTNTIVQWQVQHPKGGAATWSHLKRKDAIAEAASHGWQWKRLYATGYRCKAVMVSHVSQ